jgi:CarD family transcriptional regulator
VVLVERFESRQRGGEVTEYLSLRVVDQELLVLVPRTAMAAGPVRRVITAEEAEAVVEELGREPVEMAPWTSQGFAKVQRLVLGRNPLIVAATIRDLTAKSPGKGLGTTDRALFDRGAALLATELGVALGLGTTRARRLIGTTMTHARRLDHIPGPGRKAHQA